MDRYRLLVGGTEFWNRAAGDIAAARRRVLVQAMTFEGDTAGHAAASAMVASPALDRRLLVDAYSLYVTNDVMLPRLWWRPAAVRAEARATQALLDDTAAAGVGVRLTNPVGRNPLRFPLRNHKKLLVIDDVAYLGGINFSEHNFAWHDCMVRIDDAEVAGFLAGEFEADWSGKPAARSASFGGLEIVSLAGARNEAALAPVLELFAAARSSIELIGAYPTLPFTQAMAAAACRGCAVTIYSAAANNKPLLRDALLALAATSPVSLRFVPGMTHAKAALVDGETVLFGSVNFNLASYRGNGDLLGISREPNLVEAIDRGLFAPARAAAAPPVRGGRPRWRWSAAEGCVRLGDLALARLRHGPVRVLPWPVPGARVSPPVAPRSPCSAALPDHNR